MDFICSGLLFSALSTAPARSWRHRPRLSRRARRSRRPLAGALRRRVTDCDPLLDRPSRGDVVWEPAGLSVLWTGDGVPYFC